MAKFNRFSDVKDNAEFKEFVKSHFGIDDVSKIPDTDEYGMLYMFKGYKDDLTVEDVDYIDQMPTVLLPDETEMLQATAQKRFGKKLEELTGDETIFVKATTFEEAKGAGTLANNRQMWDEMTPEEREKMKTERKQPVYQTVKTKETLIVPDLAQSVLQHGLRNKETLAKLNTELTKEQDAERKAMFEIVRNAYALSLEMSIEDADKKLGGEIVKLNDTIKTPKDIEYAKDITKALGYDEGDYPELKKEFEFVRRIPMPENEDNIPPVTILDGGNGGDNNGPQDEQPAIIVGGDDNDGGNPGKKEDNKGPQDEQPTIVLENNEGRIRIAESDTNAYSLDVLSYKILREMNKTEELKPEELENQNKVYNTVQEAIKKLNDEENKEFNNRFYDVIVDNPAYLGNTPPSVLADAYVHYTAEMADLNQQFEKTNDSAEKQKLADVYRERMGRKEKVAVQIDTLTDMLVADTHEDTDLFFADDTNVADVYDGYKKMFDVRTQDLQAVQDKNNPNHKINEQIGKMKAGQEALDKQYASYLKFYELDNVNENSAEDLDKRYENMAKGLSEVQLNDETAQQVITENSAGRNITLGELLSSVRFYDNKGNIEPQFKDNEGHETTEWSAGAKVIKDSKLDQTIAMAKQLYVQNHLASQEDLQPEDMQKVLTEYVPQVLYATNVKSLIEKNILEKPDQYKDRETINRNVQEFIRQLNDSERPMEITDHTFTNTKNSIVNQAYAYRGVLAKQLNVTTKDNVDKTPILNKVCNHVKPFDPRPDSRVVKDVTPNVWRNYASETLQGMAAAAIGTARVKGAQLVAVGLAHAATGIATAQLALAASAVVPAALTIKQIISWRKEQKAQGKPTGFKAFFKDKNMQRTLATTALTEAAIGCMFIPGGQPVGIALGVAALGIGVGRAAINDYQKLRTAGKSKWKAALAATGGALLKVGTALVVSKAMTTFFQDHFGETEKKVHHDGQEEKSHTEIRETHEMVEGARKTLESFYRGNPEALEHDLAQVREQLHAMGRDDISPEVFLRNACDAGMNTGVDTINHVDGGGIVHTHGNNLVMTNAWATQHHIDPNDVHALGGIRGADGSITITDEALKGFDAVKFNVSVHNEIGSTLNPITGDRLAGHQDGVLGRNAMVDSDGTTIRAPSGQGTEFNTYANGESGYENIKVIDQEEIKPWDELVKDKIEYDDAPAVGMYGIRNGGWIHKMTERVGSLLDRIVGRKGVTPQPNHTQPVVGDKKQPVKEDEQPVITQPVVGDKKQPVKEDEQPVITQPIKEINPVAAEKDLLLEEFQMMYGYKPESKDATYKAYIESVKAQHQATDPSKPIQEFLVDRRKAYDDVLRAYHMQYRGNYGHRKPEEKLKGVTYLTHEEEIKLDIAMHKNDFIPANSPMVAHIREDFWKSEQGGVKDGKPMDFTVFTKSAGDFLGKAPTKPSERDEKKAPPRRIDGHRPRG